MTSLAHEPADRHDDNVRHIPTGQTTRHAAVSSDVDETPAVHCLRLVRALALVAAFALTDVVLIKTTWNTVLAESELVSWFLSVMTALVGAALMWASGHSAIHARVHQDRMHAITSIALATVWLAVGAGLLYLRWNAAELAAPAIEVEGVTADTGQHAVEKMLAVVMGVLYLAPGLMAWTDSYRLGNPIARHQRRTLSQLTAAEEELTRLESEAVKVTHLLAVHDDEISLVEQHLRTAQEANAALAEELRALARDEILRHIGDPAAGGITDPAAAGTGGPEEHQR